MLENETPEDKRNYFSQAYLNKLVDDLRASNDRLELENTILAGANEKLAAELDNLTAALDQQRSAMDHMARIVCLHFNRNPDAVDETGTTCAKRVVDAAMRGRI